LCAHKRHSREGNVYILASQKNGTLYTGVTADLIKRVYEHKSKEIKGFTSKYNITLLVYYEIYSDITEAILREKRIKKWNRAWKLKLIEKNSPHWNRFIFYTLIFLGSRLRGNDARGGDHPKSGMTINGKLT
jgi:putative endonuclease